MKMNSQMMRSTENRIDGAVDLDTALSMTGQGKFHIQLALVTGGCIAAVTTENLGLGFELPAIGCEMELSVASQGLLSAAMFMGMVLTSYGWGFASDTFGRRKILLLSIGISWVVSVCASLSPVFWLLITMRFLTGAASGTMASTIYAYVLEFLPPKNRVNFISWCCIFLGIGYCLMPVAAWLILPLTWSLDLGFVVIRSQRILSLLTGSYILATFLGMLGLPESPKYLVSVDKHQEALDVLREIYSRNTGRPPSKYPVHEIRKTIEDERIAKVLENGELSVSIILKGMKDQIAPMFGRKHISTTILGCILQFWVYWSISGLYLWLPELQNRMVAYNNANPNTRAMICDAIDVQLTINATSNVICQSEIDTTVYVGSLVLGGSLCIGFVMVGAVVNAMGKRTLIATLQLLSGLSCFGMYWATNVTLFATCVATYTVLYCLCNVLLNAVLTELYPTRLRSAALCIGVTIGRIGGAAAGFLTGILVEYNCISTIFGLGTMSIGMGLLSFAIPKSETMIKPIA